MDVQDIPQDNSPIFRGQKKVIYAIKNGKYTASQTNGWQAEDFALNQAVEELNAQTDAAFSAFQNGEKSIIYYLMYRNRYDLSSLAQTTGFWQWQIKRHFQPKIFTKLSEKKLAIYATAFGIDKETLKNG